MAKRKTKSQIGNLTLGHQKSGITPIFVRVGGMRVGGVRHTIEKLSTTTTTLL
jgi:hypothetical protein